MQPEYEIKKTQGGIPLQTSGSYIPQTGGYYNQPTGGIPVQQSGFGVPIQQSGFGLPVQQSGFVQPRVIPAQQTSYVQQGYPLPPIIRGVQVEPEIRGAPQEEEPYNVHEGLIEKDTQANKVTAWILYLCPIIYLVVIFIMSICMVCVTEISSYNLTRNSINVIQNFYDNQALEPIQNIEFLTNYTLTANSSNTTSNCSSGYSLYSFYTFPGVDSGCLCEDGSTHSSAYCLVVTSNGCESVTSRSSEAFYDFNEAYVCLQHYSSGDIEELNETGTCATGYTKCLSNYCVLSNLTCPITSLATTNTTVDQENLTFSGTTYYISRNVSKEPVVGFESPISNPSCLNPNVYPNTTSGLYYPYWETALAGCDEFGDATNWTSAITSENQTEFFQDNSIWTYLSELPYWSNYSNASDLYKLRTVSRITSGRSSACVTLKSQLSNVTDGAEDTIESIVNYAIATLILSIVGIIICLLYYFGKNLRVLKRMICQSPIVPYIILMLCFVVMVLCFIMAGDYWNNETLINEDVSALTVVDEAISENCFSDTPGMVTALNYLSTYLDQGESWIFGAVVFLFVWSLIWGIVWLACYLLRKFLVKDVVIRRPTCC